MPPKKLQVPVKIQKKQRKPKMRQRIVVKQKVNRNMPDIKMPEISGIKGGLGAAGGSGLGGAGGIGFSMPEIKVFGIRSKGEKVFIALDADAAMLKDELGGLRAYTIIKDELTKIFKSLGPTTLFNLAVFDQGTTKTLFPRMVPATRENVAQVEVWLDPLNKVTKGMGDKSYGVKTLGKSGVLIKSNGLAAGKIRAPKRDASSSLNWYTPAAFAMKEQADTVFILTGWWGILRYTDKEFPEWTEANRNRWSQRVKEGKEKLAAENKARRAKNEPPKVIRDDHFLIRAYFPNQYHSIRRPEPPWYSYTPRDLAEGLKLVRKENAPERSLKSGLSKKKKDSFSVNVIYFTQKNETARQARQIAGFTELARRSNGKFSSIAGLEAIQNSVR